MTTILYTPILFLLKIKGGNIVNHESWQKNFPSVKTLGFVNAEKAKELRKYLIMDYQEMRQHPAAKKRINECYNPPKKYDVRMHVLDTIAETYDVEGAETSEGWIDYLNTGEMYAPTIIHFQNRYYVSSLGAFVESLEKRGIRVF